MHPVARGMGVEMRGWDVVFINCPFACLVARRLGLFRRRTPAATPPMYQAVARGQRLSFQL